MSQEGAPEGSSTENPVLSPQRSCGLFQGVEEEASFKSGQGPALCLGASGEASTEQQEAEHTAEAGGDRGPAASHNQEELEVKAQPASRERLGRGFAAPTDAAAISPEPTAGKAHSGPSTELRRSKRAKRLRRGLAFLAQDQGTDRSSDDSSQNQPEQSSPGGCPTLEEMKMSHGVKQVCYELGSGAVIHLLGAISHGQARGLQLPKLEVLENMMEVSLASPAQRPRRKRRPMVQGPTGCQCCPAGAEEEKPGEQEGPESSASPGSLGASFPTAQLQPQEEKLPVDIRVRGTVVHAMQEMLWSR